MFDYPVTFDQEDTTVTGEARWDDLPIAAPVESDAGQALLDRGWEATEEEFHRDLDRVKEGLEELSDEEIMRNLVADALASVSVVDGPDLLVPTGFGEDLLHPGDVGHARIAAELAVRLDGREW